jgi:TM2 domain-containing membrane protein YozV
MTDKIIIQKRPPKSPAAAGILSGFFPGAGTLYNGQVEKAILYIVIFAGLVTFQTRAFTPQPFSGIILGCFYVFQIIEAINGAKEVNRRALLENGGEKPLPAKTVPAAATPSGSVFWGAVLMALGVVFLLANFDLLDFDRIFDFWPVIVIVIGLKMVADYFSKKNA